MTIFLWKSKICKKRNPAAFSLHEAGVIMEVQLGGYMI